MTRSTNGWLLCLLLFPVMAAAGEMAAKSIEAAVDAGFSEFERQIIEKYYGKPPQFEENAKRTQETAKEENNGKDRHAKKGKEKDTPPGLARKDKLPPGLAKRDTLPPGLAKRNLPNDLEKQLPPAPEGYERRIVNDVDQAVIVLVDKATGRIADIVKDVIIPKEK